MSIEEIIKTDIFLMLKACTDFLAPRNGDIDSMKDPSINIENFAKAHGIVDIHRVDPEINIDGKTVHIKHAILLGAMIFLNDDDNPEKQRFSIAHEMFHFLVRRPNVGRLVQTVARRGEDWKRKNEGSPEAVEETIADYFAANLLIPTEQFILWEDKTNEEIARAFGVEPKCIKKRREEEIERELDLLTPKNLSSDVNLDKVTPLSPEELERALEGHAINDTRGS